MRRTAVLTLTAAALAACSDRITSPDVAAPGDPSLAAAAARGTTGAAPIVFVISQPRVVATVPGGWNYFRYPNRPDADLGGGTAAWQYRDDPFYGPMHVMRAPLTTSAATELATVDYAAYPTANDRYTAWQSSDSTVAVVDNATGRKWQLAAPKTDHATLRLVDGQLALLRRVGSSLRDLVVYDLAAGTERVVAQVGADAVVDPAFFSFDGRWAGIRATNNLTGIVVVDTRNGQQRMAVPYRSGGVSGPWIDAGQMVYSLMDAGKTYTYVQDLASGATREVSSAAPPVASPYPDTRLRQTSARISGSLVVWTDMRRDSSDSQGYPQHTDVYLYDLASGVEMPVSTAPGWSGDARVSGNHLLWTRSRDGAGGLAWELVTADVTPVSVPLLMDELKKMEAAGTVPAQPLGRVLETLLAQAQSRRMGKMGVITHLRQFAAMVHRNAGTKIDAAAAQRLEGMANGVILRMSMAG